MNNNKLKMYCISIDENDFKLIEDLSYIPVGLGEADFSNKWTRDNEGINISKKNKWYSELTFHYNFWKNKITYSHILCCYGYCDREQDGYQSCTKWWFWCYSP